MFSLDLIREQERECVLRYIDTLRIELAGPLRAEERIRIEEQLKAVGGEL